MYVSTAETYVVISVAATGLLALVRRAGRRRPVAAQGLFLVVALAATRLLSLPQSWLRQDAVTNDVTVVEILAVGAAGLAFAWIGLAVLWPGRAKSARVRPAAAARQLAAGLAVGAVPGLALFHPARPGPLAGRTSLALALIATVLVSVLQEEVFYRGALFSFLEGRGLRADAVNGIQTAVFAAVHVPDRWLYVSAFGDLRTAVGSIAAVVLGGWIFGALRARTGRLWMPVGAHTAWNLLGFLSFWNSLPRP